MKKSLFLLCILSIGRIACAQDSIRIAYSEESDTLVKQRFIDRYENVFMTKVPTRQMFKIGAFGSEVYGAGITMGYEYKLLPSVSVEASVNAQFSRANSRLLEEFFSFAWQDVSLWGNAKVRWYPNMKKRIASGLNANNFSGTYVALSYKQSLVPDRSWQNRTSSRLALMYGFQSRFFNQGHVDLAVGVFQNESGQLPMYERGAGRFNVKNFVLGTQMNIGLAFGDWKKTKAAPLCDVLFCDEEMSGQLKVQMPDFLVGLNSQIARAGVAYERKIGSSPFSAQVDVDGSIFKTSFPNSDRLSSLYAGAGMELRYYFLRNFLMRHGKGGSSFSGPYAGLRGSYSISSFESVYYMWPAPTMKGTARNWSGALLLGYQQRLFNRLYIDGSISLRKTSTSGFNVAGSDGLQFHSKFSVGFTF